MKILKNIVSIILVFAVVNTFASKAVHEFFEHHEEIHECVDKDITHFHESEVQHQDLICSFNLSTSLLSLLNVEIKNIINYYNNLLRVEFTRLIKEFHHYHFSKRGPPTIK